MEIDAIDVVIFANLIKICLTYIRSVVRKCVCALCVYRVAPKRGQSFDYTKHLKSLLAH